MFGQLEKYRRGCDMSITPVSGLNMRGGRLRPGPSRSLCTGYSQELRHSGEFKVDEDQGGVLAQSLNRMERECIKSANEFANPAAFLNYATMPESFEERYSQCGHGSPPWLSESGVSNSQGTEGLVRSLFTQLLSALTSIPLAGGGFLSLSRPYSRVLKG